FSVSLFILRPPPHSPSFPSTTLFRSKGSIVFISSVAGLDPLPGLGAYSISKAGLLGLMRVLARELGSRGVRVNAIAPGLIETRLDRKSTRLNSSHQIISYAVFCLKKK